MKFKIYYSQHKDNLAIASAEDCLRFISSIEEKDESKLREVMEFLK